MSKKVAQVIVETLEAAGVKNCYEIVGDTLNVIAGYIRRSGIDWVHMRHEEAGAFAAQAEAQLMDRLTAMAGSCWTGRPALHQRDYEAKRNRAPVILLATQVATTDLGFHFIQEVDFKSLFRLHRILRHDLFAGPGAQENGAGLPNRDRRARSGRPYHSSRHSRAEMHDMTPFAVQVSHPVIRPSDAELEKDGGAAERGRSHRHLWRRGMPGRACGSNGRRRNSAGAGGLYFPRQGLPSARQSPWIGDRPARERSRLSCGPGLRHAVFSAPTLPGGSLSWHANIVQVDIEPAHLGQRHPVALGVTGSIKPTLQALLPHLKPRKTSHFYDSTIEHYRTMPAHHDAAASKPGPGHAFPGSWWRRCWIGLRRKTRCSARMTAHAASG